MAIATGAGQERRRLPRPQRALRPAHGPGRLGRHHLERSDPLVLVHAVRPADARLLDRPPGARSTCTSTAPRPSTSATSPMTQRKHAQNNPNAAMYGKPMTMDDYMNVAHDLRAAAPVRLLPGGRRRLCPPPHHGRSARCDLKQKPADRPSRDPGLLRRPGADDELLPRRPRLRFPRWSSPQSASTSRAGLRPERHRRRLPLRRLHPRDPDAARGLRLLRHAARRRTS